MLAFFRRRVAVEGEAAAMMLGGLRLGKDRGRY